MNGLLNRQVLALAGGIFLASWLGQSPSATAQASCQSLAAQTVRAINFARNKGCNVSTGRSYNFYLRQCAAVSAQSFSRAAAQWINYARSCRGRAGRGAGGANTQQCRAIAQATMNAVNFARRKGCAIRGNPSAAGFFNGCTRNINGARRLLGQWNNYARSCRGAGGANNQQCRSIAQATMNFIRTARNKRCRIQGNPTFNSYLVGCQRNIANARRTMSQWAAYARSCRPAGGQANQQQCRAIAQATMNAVSNARRKRCTIRGKHSFNGYFANCMRNIGNARAVLGQWNTFVRSCRPAGGQANQQQCRAIAQATMNAVSNARRKRCTIRGKHSFNGYFANCVRNIGNARAVLGQWNTFVRSCRPAGGANTQQCRGIATATMKAVSTARGKRCAISGNPTFTSYLNNCNRNIGNARTVLNQWVNYARSCRPSAAGRATFCNAIVNSTMASIRNIRAKRCTLPASTLTTPAAIRRVCMTRSLTASNSQLVQLRNFARTCRPTGGAGGKAAFCRTAVANTMAAVNAARTKGCRINPQATRASFQQSCNANTRNVTNGSVRSWQNFARTCRPVGGGNTRYCNQVVASAMAAIRTARGKRCTLPAAAQTSPAAIRAFCRGNNRAATNRQLSQLQNFARTCRPAGGAGGANAAQCRALANTANASVFQARRKGCTISGNPTLTGFFNICMRNGLPAIRARAAGWSNYARTCRPAGAAATTAAFCNRNVAATMTSVRAARAKGCALGTTGNPAAIRRACLRGNQAAANRNLAAWRNFARTCRPTRGPNGNTAFCLPRVNQLVAAANQARAKGCRVSPASNRASFMRGCLTLPRTRTTANITAWNNFVRTCRPTRGAGFAAFCRRQANTAMTAVGLARTKRCRVGPGANRTAFNNACLRATRGATRANTASWQRYARTCRPVTGIGTGVSRAFCRNAAIQTRASIIAARNRGCNVRTARSFSFYFRNCLISARNVTTRIQNGWSRYARTCRASVTQCPAIFQPVCAVVGGVRRTFPNSCVAQRQGGRRMVAGRCAVIGGPSVGGGNPGGPNLGGPNLAGPNLGGPNPGGPTVRGPRGGGPTIRPGGQGPKVTGPKVKGPKITGPGVKGPNLFGPGGKDPNQKGEGANARSVFFDDFKEDKLGPLWEVLRPNTDAYLVEKGFLTILSGSEQTTLADDTVPNLFRLLQQMPDGNWQATMQFTPEFQAGTEAVFFGLHKDKDNSVLGYFELKKEGDKCMVTLRAGRYLRGKYTGSSKTEERKDTCGSSGANSLGIPVIAKPKPIQLRLTKVGRSYVVSAKLSDSPAAKFVALDRLTLLRAKWNLALGIYLKDGGKGEGVVNVDWVRIETID